MELNKKTKQQLAEALKNAEEALHHWKNKFQFIHENASEIQMAISPEGFILSINKQGLMQLGYLPGQLTGKPYWKIVHPDDLKVVKSKLKQLLETNQPTTELKSRKICNDKSVIYVEDHFKLFTGPGGKPAEIHISSRPHTPSSQSNLHETQSPARFSDLTDHLNVGLYRSTVDIEGAFIEVNTAFVRMLGYDEKQDIYNLKVSDIYKHAADRAELQRKIHAKGFIKNQEVILQKKNGDTINASLSAILTRDHEGNPAFYDGIIDDISETKLILNAIRDSEYKYRSLVESFHDIIFITDYQSKMLFANQALYKHTGFTLRDFQMPQNENRFIHPEDREKVAVFITAFINGIARNSGFIENRFVDKYDNVHWFSSVITKIDYENQPALQFIVRDITKQKEADEELKKRERQYGTLFNLSPNGIIIEDSNGLILDVNPAYCELMGYEKKELMGFNVKSLSHPDARPHVQNNINRILNGEQLSHTEKSIKKDGTIAYVHLNERKIELPNGQTGIICIAEDITEQTRAEEALKQSEQKYRLLIENQNDLVVKVDGKGRFTFVSPSYCRLFGKTEQALLNKMFMPLVHHHDRDKTIEEMKKLQEPPHTCYVEQRAKTVYGWRWIAWVDTAVLDENQQVKEIIGVGRDITDRKNAEDALLKSEESYKGLFNSATDAIYVMDKNGLLLDANEEALKIYGHKKEKIIGKKIDFFAAPGQNDLKQIKKLFALAFKGQPQKFEFWSLDKNDRLFPQEIRLHKSTYFGEQVVVVFAQDITARKSAQQNLEEKEKRFRRIFNAFPDIYFKSNMDGVIKEVSPSVTKITGYQPDEVIGIKSSRFYYSQDEWKAIGMQLQQYGEVNDFDIQIVTRNNSRIYCSLTARLIYHDNNQPYEIEGVLRDITDRINAELEIKENQRRIATLMANLPGMAYRCRNDRNYTMEFISQGCTDLTGYQPEALIFNNKLSYNDLIHPDDRDMVWKTIQAAMKKKNLFRLVYRIQHASGETRWVWEQGMGIFNDAGALIALEGFISNITDQREAEDEIRKLSRSVEQSPTIIVIADLEGNVEYINPRFVEVTGYSYDEIIGKNPRILKSGNTPNAVYKDLWKTVTSGKKWSGEFQNRKKNGDLYWESANIFPLKDENDKITHYIGMKEDITERKLMEQELIVAKNKAEESDKLKSAFLANMSHEIRTPMNAIIGFSQLLDDPDLQQDERNHYINLIQNSGNDLMNLIDDIIDISKIEAGQMKIFKSQYMIDQLMRDLYNGFIEQIKTKPKTQKLKITYSAPEKANEIIVNTDIDRFKQVMRNLFFNAIKFTDQGYVEFGFEANNPAYKNDLLFFVKDSGIGIDPEKKEVIFNSFTQANDSDTRLYGGTGLGLAISKNIIELLGGKIWVESEPGKGATFFFTLPKLSEPKASMGSKSQSKEIQLHEFDWSKKNILVVEDDDSSYDFFERILRRTGAYLMRAEDGMQAVKKFKQNKFDIVLLDIRLPRMDGYKTMKKIKTINPEIPVIAQTAYAMQGEKDKCLKAGFDNYLSKPIKINELLKMVSRYINN